MCDGGAFQSSQPKPKRANIPQWANRLRRPAPCGTPEQLPAKRPAPVRPLDPPQSLLLRTDCTLTLSWWDAAAKPGNFNSACVIIGLSQGLGCCLKTEEVRWQRVSVGTCFVSLYC
jgi:hypothetical protein